MAFATKQYLLSAACLVFISVAVTSSAAEQDVTYAELGALGYSCNDTCAERNKSDSLSIYPCHCSSYCADLNTCCLDSPYRNETISPESPDDNVTPSLSCVDLFGTNYFISDRCPDRWTGPPTIRRMCEDGWTGEDDLLLLAPVTSRDSNVTYKNYFCFKCSENSENVTFWNLLAESDEALAGAEGLRNMSFEYDRRDKTWMASSDGGTSYFPVELNMLPPQDVTATLRSCYRNVVSRCAEDWADSSVRRKCESYMALVKIDRDSGAVRYRNPHCAICNRESNRGVCREITGYGAAPPFSFSLLLDINRSDGEEVGKVQRCSGDAVWDPYFEKCRTLACALPGHVAKDGKCTAV